MVRSSGAKAKNLAVKGICEQRLGQESYLVTVVAAEHGVVLVLVLVLEPCRCLERLGFALAVLPVRPMDTWSWPP